MFLLVDGDWTGSFVDTLTTHRWRLFSDAWGFCDRAAIIIWMMGAAAELTFVHGHFPSERLSLCDGK